jgi:hypothetical protein
MKEDQHRIVNFYCLQEGCWIVQVRLGADIIEVRKANTFAEVYDISVKIHNEYRLHRPR